MSQLEGLKTFTVLCSSSNGLQEGFEQGWAFSVVPLRPVIPCSARACDELTVRQQMSIQTASCSAEMAWIEVEAHYPGAVPIARGGEVGVQEMWLEGLRRSEGTGRVDVVLSTDRAQELIAELRATLSAPNLYDFPHSQPYFPSLALTTSE